LARPTIGLTFRTRTPVNKPHGFSAPVLTRSRSRCHGTCGSCRGIAHEWHLTAATMTPRPSTPRST
jgi:hypothetical protein